MRIFEFAGCRAPLTAGRDSEQHVYGEGGEDAGRVLNQALRLVVKALSGHCAQKAQHMVIAYVFTALSGQFQGTRVCFVFQNTAVFSL